MLNILKNNQEWFSKPRLVCGIMTGTSVDGIDVAFVRFKLNEEGKHIFDLLGHDTYKFKSDIINAIHDLLTNKIPISLVSKLNFDLSRAYFDSIKKLAKKLRIQLNEIDAVGIHGQTIWHEPPDNNKLGHSLQLASTPVLANLLQLPVVGDFRSADIALGGQGAPLVPIFDYEFLANKNENVIALNIGGISNITVIKANCKKNELIAFDTGPGNTLIDSLMKHFFSKDYDKNGYIANNGKLIPQLLNELMKNEFISKKPPKSTGRELFNLEFLFKIIQELDLKYEPKDLITTFTHFTSKSIAYNIENYSFPSGTLYVSGGGSKNDYLMQQLSYYLPNFVIKKTDEFGIPIDAKESICFAYLAYRTLGGLSSNIPSVTGAKREAILGVIANV